MAFINVMDRSKTIIVLLFHFHAFVSTYTVFDKLKTREHAQRYFRVNVYQTISNGSPLLAAGCLCVLLNSFPHHQIRSSFVKTHN